MSTISVIIVAVGLSMDALAVSVATGFRLPPPRVRAALTLGLWFGAFQALMPVFGWLAGSTLHNLITSIDHWIAFALLAGIGLKMILGSRRGDGAEPPPSLTPASLLLLSVATSIDALAVGVSLAFLGIAIIGPVLLIGLVTFSLSFAGTFVGGRAGHFLQNKAEIAGGLVLIAIGAKILVEHVYLA